MIKVYNKLKNIVETDYKNIIIRSIILREKSVGSSKLRIFLKDHSFLDIWLSSTGKYSYHWEQRAQRGLIYRHDNAPDFPKIKTYPKHLHNGDEKNVRSSNISDDPQKAIRQILDYIKRKLK